MQNGIIMSSEKHKDKKEFEFYEKIKTLLVGVFEHYVEKRTPMGGRFYEKNPHLEITAYGEFSPKLLRAFSRDTLTNLTVEKIKPDVMGWVKKKEDSEKELITVEVKRSPIELIWILKAKLYQELFGSKWSLLISTEGIAEDKVRFLSETNLGRKIRGEVIIAEYKEHTRIPDPMLQIHHKFKKSIPEPFKSYVRPP
jgi:hypothetical protein